MKIVLILSLAFLMVACSQAVPQQSETVSETKKVEKPEPTVLIPAVDHYAELEKDPKLMKATFAGGCFWCLDGPFDNTDGVVQAFTGYGGVNPENEAKYELVVGGTTKYRESVQVFYDPEIVSYVELLDIFWRQIDPTDSGGQFADRGFQYTTAIYAHTPEQRVDAEASKKNLQESGKFDEDIVTEIDYFTAFELAEENHQNYYIKRSQNYILYKKGSGRAGFIEKNWDRFPKLTKEELKTKLTPLEYHITQNEGTERPFDNEYWNEKRDGIYTDIVTGEALFSSTDKFDSGTGWPSFTQPINEGLIKQSVDTKIGVPRTEIKSKNGETHLGHLFEDGPEESGGKRYCVNSASLKFIPKEDLEKEGFGKYRELFEGE